MPSFVIPIFPAVRAKCFVLCFMKKECKLLKVKKAHFRAASYVQHNKQTKKHYCEKFWVELSAGCSAICLKCWPNGVTCYCILIWNAFGDFLNDRFSGKRRWKNLTWVVIRLYKCFTPAKTEPRFPCSLFTKRSVVLVCFFFLV